METDRRPIKIKKFCKEKINGVIEMRSDKSSDRFHIKIYQKF